MGYYENPPIINFNEGYNRVTAGIVDASKTVAEALIKKGERDRLTTEKLQQQKNETDLAYNAKLAQWDASTPIQNEELNGKIHGMLQQKIQIAADAKIALLSETDSAKRQEYLKLIRNADVFMSNAAGFAKNVAMDTATWRENAAAIAVGQENGWVINGKDADEIGARTGAVEILGKMDQMYDNHSIDIEDMGDSFRLKIKGKRKGNENGFDIGIDAKSYLSSDNEGGGGFLQKVENLDEFKKSSKKNLVDDKGNLKENFVSQNPETVKLNDKYQIVYGQRLDDTGIKNEIRKQAEIKASGYLRANKEASLRSLLNYTLKQGPEYYDSVFKNPNNTVEMQQKMLTELLTEQAFGSLTSDLHKTKEGDQEVYWGPNSKIDLINIPKPSTKSNKAGGGLTAKQKNQADLNSELQDAIASGNGIVNGRKGLIFEVENGKATVYEIIDQTKVPVEGLGHDANKLAKYVGGTIKTPLKK